MPLGAAMLIVRVQITTVPDAAACSQCVMVSHLVVVLLLVTVVLLLVAVLLLVLSVLRSTTKTGNVMSCPTHASDSATSRQWQSIRHHVEHEVQPPVTFC
jgi:hypothetical protein